MTNTRVCKSVVWQISSLMDLSWIKCHTGLQITTNNIECLTCMYKKCLKERVSYNTKYYITRWHFCEIDKLLGDAFDKYGVFKICNLHIQLNSKTYKITLILHIFVVSVRVHLSVDVVYLNIFSLIWFCFVGVTWFAEFCSQDSGWFWLIGFWTIFLLRLSSLLWLSSF